VLKLHLGLNLELVQEHKINC